MSSEYQHLLLEHKSFADVKVETALLHFSHCSQLADSVFDGALSDLMYFQIHYQDVLYYM